MADGGEILIERRGGIVRATINRPAARNAMTAEMSEHLLELLDAIQHDPAARVLLLDAAGDNFIAGGDVKSFARGLDMSAEERGEDMAMRAARAGRLCAAIAQLPQPVIAAARGFVVGYGMSILCAADLVILSETARLMLSHVSLGINPDGAATWLLPRQVGLKRATQIALLGEPMGAAEATAMGLANWVVPDGQLDEQARVLAEKIALGPRVAQREIKGLIGSSHARDIAGQVEAEVAAMRRSAASADFAEGLTAITGKRKPQFGKD